MGGEELLAVGEAEGGEAATADAAEVVVRGGDAGLSIGYGLPHLSLCITLSLSLNSLIDRWSGRDKSYSPKR